MDLTLSEILNGARTTVEGEWCTAVAQLDGKRGWCAAVFPLTAFGGAPKIFARAGFSTKGDADTAAEMMLALRREQADKVVPANGQANKGATAPDVTAAA